MNKIREDVQKVVKLSEVTLPTVRAIASAMLNAGQPVYYCTIGEVKTAIIKD